MVWFWRRYEYAGKNPLPPVAIITPKVHFQSADTLKTLRALFAATQGVDEVRMDERWLTRLSALTGLLGKVSAMIGILVVIAVFLVIGNSIRLSIFRRCNTISVMRLINATYGFILRPFLNDGALLGLAGAVLSLILSGTLVWQLESVVANVAMVVWYHFVRHGLSWDQAILLLVIWAMIGLLSAWLAPVQHLCRFTPD